MKADTATTLNPPLTRGGREGLVCVAYHENLIKLARENRKYSTAAEYGMERTQPLGDLGITVVRYTNDGVLRNPARVYDDLMRRAAGLDIGFSVS